MTTPGFNVVLPTIIVEASLNPNAPGQTSGTLLLDDATFGKLDTDTLGGVDTWTNITPWVKGFSVTRFSTRVQGPLYQWQPGTAQITLDNTDGRFDPDNLSGPYVTGGVSQIRAMVPVRIRAIFNGVTYYVFRGFADGWQEPQIVWANQPPYWTLSATDGFKALSNILLPTIGAVGANELSGARMQRILNSAGWYTGSGTGARKIDAGESQVQATTYGDYALNLLQTTADSEIGEVYIDGSGAFIFRQRQAYVIDSRSNTSQATFGDNPIGSEFPCATIARLDDDTTIGNDIQAQIVGSSNLQEVKNTTSIAQYLFPRTYNRTDLILTTDAAALQWAQWVLYISAFGENRFDSIVVDPSYQPLDLWPQVLGREIGDRITGVRRPLNVPGSVSKDGFIAAITHVWDTASSNWNTTWSLMDASKYGSFLTLDNPVSGQLDHNALVF